MATRQEKIARLTDQQAPSIVDSLAGEMADEDAPEGQQTQMLWARMAEHGQAPDVHRVAKADTASAAASARQLLLMMAQGPEMEASLDDWLDNSPTQEAMAAEVILGAPAVLSGCIVLLQVAGHVRTFEFEGLRDPEAMVRELEAKGIKVENVRMHGDGPGYSVYVYDPCGNRIELSTDPS